MQVRKERMTALALCNGKLSVETCVFFFWTVNKLSHWLNEYGYTKVHSLIQTPISFLKQGQGAQSCTHKNGKLAPCVSIFNRLLKDQHNQMIQNARCDPICPDDRRPTNACRMLYWKQSDTSWGKKKSFQYMSISVDSTSLLQMFALTPLALPSHLCLYPLVWYLFSAISSCQLQGHSVYICNLCPDYSYLIYMFKKYAQYIINKKTKVGYIMLSSS